MIQVLASVNTLNYVLVAIVFKISMQIIEESVDRAGAPQRLLLSSVHCQVNQVLGELWLGLKMVSFSVVQVTIEFGSLNYLHNNHTTITTTANWISIPFALL